ncbi:MAG: ABC transporter ATP-binding protein [Anaerolineales bacterium]|nr:ABC transporter ATP-binding protein [Anaerolineales bacterium]
MRPAWPPTRPPTRPRKQPGTPRRSASGPRPCRPSCCIRRPGCCCRGRAWPTFSRTRPPIRTCGTWRISTWLPRPEKPLRRLGPGGPAARKGTLSAQTQIDTQRTAAQNGNILEVRQLKTYFYTEDGIVQAVDGVDLTVRRGEVLGLVGESGCGKSVTSLSIMRLVGVPGKIIAGAIIFDGQDLLKLPEAEMVHIRGNRISMIFQQPQSSLNPVFKVGDQIAEVLDIHRSLGREAGWARAIELLKMVGIPDAERRAHAFPHELSGGMAQRVMIAMALACVPELLIADEPTTALDVTIQAQILDLMREIRLKMQASIILITHDLGVVAEMCERVAVMYAGQIVEQTDVQALFAGPKHPYTQGLIGSIPILGVIKDTLDVIPGSVPNLIDLPVGCRFAPRCRAREQYGLAICTQAAPDLRPVAPDHSVRCWLYHHDPEHGHRAPLAASV